MKPLSIVSVSNAVYFSIIISSGHSPTHTQFVAQNFSRNMPKRSFEQQ